MNNRKIFYQAVIPSMLAFALSGIYSVADGFFVGNSLGDNALAAINIAYPLTAFIQAVGPGLLLPVPAQQLAADLVAGRFDLKCHLQCFVWHSILP